MDVDPVVADVVDDVESVESDPTETKFYAVDNMTFSTPEVLEGTANYPIFLTTTNLIPLPIADKTVNINFNGISEDYTTNVLGLINYKLPAAPAGEYEIEMTFNGDDRYIGSTLTTSVVIEDVETMIISLGNASYARPIIKEGLGYYPIALTTNTTIPLPLANRSVYVEFDGDGDVYTTNSLGIINYILPNDTIAGTYDVYAAYLGGDGYIYSDMTSSVEIFDVETMIVSLGNASIPRLAVWEGLGYYPIALTTNTTIPLPLANRSVYIEFDGFGDIYTTNELGIVNYTLPNVTSGFYEIYVVYEGEDGFIYSTMDSTVEIFDIPTRFYGFDNLTYTYTDVVNKHAVYPILFTTNTTIPIILPNKLIIVEFNGVGGEFNTSDLGLVFYRLYDATAGTYDIKAFYYGDEDLGLLPAEFASQVVIERAATEIEAEDVTVEYGDSEGKLVATLVDDYGNPLPHAGVNIALAGVDYALKANTKGQVELSLAELLPGNYTATISYKGNSKKFYGTSTDVNVLVTKQTTFIDAVYDNKTQEIVATLTDVSGKALGHANILISVGGNDYTVKTNSKGQAVLSVADLEPSIYLAELSYKGNKVYLSTIAHLAFFNFNVFIVAPDVTVDVGDETGKFVATLYDIDGNPLKGAYLTVKIGDETYKLKTKAKGQVEVSTANLTAGTYDVTISYKGNAKGLTPYTTTAVITVKEYEANLTASYDYNNGLIITLKDAADGNPLKGANVVVKVDGKSYKVKIDSTGQGKIVFEDLEPGAYVASISYKGNAKYAPVSTTERIVIRES